MKDFQHYLPLLKSGKLSDINLSNLVESFKKNEVKFAENLQYAIYGYCLNDVDGKQYHSVQKLVGVCYSDSAIHGLKNVSRFVGCIASICLYFFKCKKIEDAVLLTTVFKKKESELKIASAASDVRNNLFVIHHHFIEAAVKQKDKLNETLILLTASLTPLEYIENCDSKIAQKFVRNIKHAIFNVGTDDTNVLNKILIQAKSIITKVSTNEEFKYSFQKYFAARIIVFINTKQFYEDPKKLNLKCKNEMNILLTLMNFKCDNHWINVIDYFTIAGSSLEQCIASTNFIMKHSHGEDRQLFSLLLSNFFTISLWSNVQGFNYTVNDVKLIYSKFVKYLWSATIDYRSYEVETLDRENNHFYLIRSLGQCWVTLTFLSRTCFKQRSEDCLDLIPIALDAFRSCCMCLDSNKIENTSNFQCNLYGDAVVRVVNSVENILSLVNDGHWSILEDFCQKIIKEMILSKQPLPIEKHRFNLLFSRWHLACCKQNKHLEAMTVSTYQVCAVDCDIDEAVISWIRSKHASTEIDNDMIFWEFIVSKLSEIGEFGLDALTLDRKTIIIAEVRAYQTIGTPDVEKAVQKLWNYFLTLNPTAYESAQVLNYAIAAIAHLSDQKTLYQWISEAKKIEESFARLKNAEVDLKLLCFEGILKYSSFVCLVNMSRTHCSPESRKKILNLLKSKAEKKIMFGEDGDMNLTCDITPAEGLLSLEKEGVNLEALGCTLNTWLDLPALWYSGCLPTDYVNLILDHLHLIANTASLYGAADLTIRAWTLYYQIASLTDEKSHQLQALAALLKECDCGPESPMVLCGLELCQQLQNNGDIKKLPNTTIEALFSCSISIANIYLHHRDIKKCGELLQKCSEFQQVVRSETVFLMMKGLWVCSISRLLSYAPDCDLFPKYRNYHHTAFSAIHCVKAALKAATHTSLCSKQQSQLLLTLLDVSTWTAAVFHSLLLTPFVRAFLEDLYTICQSLQFTARTAQILSILAEVDLNTRKLSDAKLKLSNLNSMVALAPLFHSSKETSPRSNNLQVEIPRCASNISPLRCMPSREVDLSPICALLPRIDSTKTTVRPAKLWNRALLVLLELKTRSSEAVAAAMAGDNVTSRLYHMHCQSIIKSFEMAQYHSQIQQELSLIFPNESLGYMQRDYSLTVARVLMDFAAFSMLPNSPTSGQELQLIVEADKCINTLSYGKCFLDWSLLELKICIYLRQNKKEKSANILDVPSVSKCRAKTPLMNKKLGNALAPKRHDGTNDLLVTPINPPKIGRRIFQTKVEAIEKSPVSTRIRRILVSPVGSPINKPEDSIGLNLGPKRSRRILGSSTDSNNKSPAATNSQKVDQPKSYKSPLASNELQTRSKRMIVNPTAKDEKIPGSSSLRKIMKTPAVASLRATRYAASKLTQETVNISSGSSVEFISSPSPDISTTLKKTKRTRVIQAKPTILIFDESKAENNGNTSKDLFDSFEKQLKISKPKIKKPQVKKALPNEKDKIIKTTRL